MKANFTYHVSRFTFHILCALLFALCLSAGAFAQNGPQAAVPPITRAPEDKDQLALVRLRAVMAEAKLQMRQAEESFNAAKERGTKADAEFNALLESTVAKAPPASKGHHWQWNDDGRGGYVLVEREDPTVATAGVTVPASQPAQTAAQGNSSPPKPEKPVSSAQNAKPKGGEQE